MAERLSLYNNPTKQADMSKIEKHKSGTVQVECYISFVPFEKEVVIETISDGHFCIALSKSELEELINHLTELKNKMQ